MKKALESAEIFAQSKNGKIETFEGFILVTYELVAAVWMYNTKYPDHCFIFKTEAQRAEWIEEQKAKAKQRQAEKQIYLAKIHEENNKFKPGAIVYESWGYEQTNVDFYQVVKVSLSSVWLQPIGSRIRETGFMSGQAEPNRGEKTGAVMVRKFGKYGVKIESHRGTLSIYEGRSISCSWYG
jgi:hypothetical protein